MGKLGGFYSLEPVADEQGRVDNESEGSFLGAQGCRLDKSGHQGFGLLCFVPGPNRNTLGPTGDDIQPALP